MYYLEAEYLHSELMNKLIAEDIPSRQRNRGLFVHHQRSRQQ